MLGLDTNGLGVVRALARYRIPIVCIDSDFLNPYGFTRYCKKVKYKDLSDENLIDFLIDFSKRKIQKPVLFITSDVNVMMISRHEKELRKYFYFNIPNDHVVEMLINKKKFAEFAEKNGFIIPRTYFVSNENEIKALADKIQYPYILKPNFRSAIWPKNRLDKVFKINDSLDFINRYKEMSAFNKDVIIQEWIPGPDSEIYFCLFYFNSDSYPLAHFVGRKIRQFLPECGSTSLAVGCRQDYVLSEGVRLFKMVGFKGIGSVEFKRDSRDGIFKIMEPTVGRTNLQSGIACASGVNIPYIAYMDVLGNNAYKSSIQVYGIKWLNEEADLYSALYYIKNKKLNARQWMSSLRGKMAFSILSLRDPAPAIILLYKLALKTLKILGSKIKNCKFAK